MLFLGLTSEALPALGAAVAALAPCLKNLDLSENPLTKHTTKIGGGGGKRSQRTWLGESVARRNRKGTGSGEWGFGSVSCLKPLHVSEKPLGSQSSAGPFEDGGRHWDEVRKLTTEEQAARAPEQRSQERELVESYAPTGAAAFIAAASDQSLLPAEATSVRSELQVRLLYLRMPIG